MQKGKVVFAILCLPLFTSSGLRLFMASELTYDTIILGAGAAGMMCAAQCGGRVLVIDHAKKPGEKIRISGGGRCNFTNLHAAPDRFISNNPHFVKSALSRYTQWDFLDLVQKHHIAYHEKTLGQLFCDDSAREIVAMLLVEMEHAKAELRLQTSVRDVAKTEGGFNLTLTGGEQLSCQNFVVACGGKPIPKMGATGFGLDLAQHFKVPVTDTRAGLVPLTFSGEILDGLSSLAGLSLPVRVSCGDVSFDESMLFTHRGLSGPAILQISSYWRETLPITINLWPDGDLLCRLTEKRHKNGRRDISTVLADFLPKRLVSYLGGLYGWCGKLADLGNNDLKKLIQQLYHWQLTPTGSEGYRTAEVMLGGVDTNALSSKTMEVKAVKGLYFIGETVDVTGWLGGYNFQWAWSSGYAAGTAIRQKSH